MADMVDDKKMGPRIRRREKWVELPEEYAGFQVLIWVNAPARLWTAVQRSDEDEGGALKALGEIVLEHNGWLDFDGQPFPPAADAAFWEEIPTELAGVVLAATMAVMGELPNSMAPKGRRSRRG